MKVNIWKGSTMVLAGALAFVMYNGVAPEAHAEAQPHMRAALASLKTAKKQLEKSSHDKGGHRVKALAITKQAITQVEKGIAFDNKH